jgi:hypothetical protein
MLELSMHILDIAENSIRAAAQLVEIRIIEDTVKDTFTIEIIDNGEGMDAGEARNVLDPFYTSKKVRTVGLGLPLFEQATTTAGGHLSITTKRGMGTTVRALFTHSHIDRQPLGNMAETMVALVAGNPEVDFRYTHIKNNMVFTMDTRDIRNELGNIPINHARVLGFIKESIIRELKDIGINE